MSTLKYILFGTEILFSQSLISIWDIFVNLLDLISNLTLVLFFILEIKISMFVLFFNEIININFIVGTLLVLLGTIISTTKLQKKT